MNTGPADFYRELGARIASARKNKGNLTQAQLARAVGLSRTSITNVEKGRQSVLVHTLVEIARVLRADPRDLLPYDSGHVPATLKAAEHQALGPAKRDWIARVLGAATERKGEHGEESTTEETTEAELRSGGASRGSVARGGGHSKAAGASGRLGAAKRR